MEAIGALFAVLVMGAILLGLVYVSQTVSSPTNAPGREDGQALRGQLWRLTAMLSDGVTVAGNNSEVAEGKLQGRDVRVVLSRTYKGRQPMEYKVKLNSRLLTLLRATEAGVPAYNQVFQPGEDEALSFKALSDDRVQRQLATLFTRFAIDELRVADGWLVLYQRDAAELTARGTQGARRLLHRGITLARALEAVVGPTPIKATVRLKKVEGQTCPFCRDALHGELELVSCGKCETLLHADCFTELGRCTTTGCRWTEALPVRRREGGIVPPLTITFLACEACGATKRGCTAEACASSPAEQARHGRQRAYERRSTRQRQHEQGPRRRRA